MAQVDAPAVEYDLDDVDDAHPEEPVDAMFSMSKMRRTMQQHASAAGTTAELRKPDGEGGYRPVDKHDLAQADLTMKLGQVRAPATAYTPD